MTRSGRVTDWVIKLCSVVLQLAGLMALTESRIPWRDYLADVVSAYRRYISTPIERVLHDLAARWQLDIDWIPHWFVDYLPIASIFSFGLLHALAQVEGQSSLQMARTTVRDIYRDLRSDTGPTLLGLVLALVVFVFLGLTAPAFFIVWPAAVVAFFVAAITLGVVFYGAVLMFAVTRVLPWASFAVLVALAICLLISERRFLRVMIAIRRGAITRAKGASETFRSFCRALPDKIRESLPEVRTEVGESWAKYVRLIATQYRIAGVVFFLFLTLVAVNYAFFEAG